MGIPVLAAMGIGGALGLFQGMLQKSDMEDMARAKDIQIDEIERRAAINSDLILEKGTKLQSSARVQFGKGNVTGTGVERVADEIFETAEFEAQRIQDEAFFSAMQIGTERDRLRSKAKVAPYASLISGASSFGFAAAKQ